MISVVRGQTRFSGMSDGTVAAPGQYFQADANTGLWRPGDDLMVLVAGGAEVLRVADVAGVLSARVKGLLDLSQADAGRIAFPATQVPWPDANTLDDYEEVDFTPSITSGFTTPAYTSRNGTATKIGRLVLFSLFLNVGGGTRNGSAFKIGGLPYTSETPEVHAATFGYAVGVVAAATPLPSVAVNDAQTVLQFWNNDTGAAVVGTDFASATPIIRLTGCYQTDT